MPRSAVQLADDHHDRGSRHISRQQRPREIAADEPEASEPAKDQDDAGDQGEAGGERGVASRIPAAQRGHDRHGQERDGRLGPDAHLADAADEGVADDRAERRVQPDDRVHPRELPVGQGLRHEERPDGQRGQDVGTEPWALVGAQLCRQRDRVEEPACRRRSGHLIR